MNTFISGAQVGKRNIYFGSFLFLLFAFVIGVPLTLDFLGLSVMSSEQYELWKVVHAYGLFLGVVNYLIGTSVDKWSISARQKEVLSWSFVVAGLFGAIGRMTLVLLSAYEDWHLLASLGEVVFFSIGLAVYIYGWTREKKPAGIAAPGAEGSRPT
jgi:prepilin signal peptidase PulO-like enzyme (type II secretory pathway)